MRQILDNKGFSRVEVICIVGISLVGVALLCALLWYMLSLMQQGDDANTMNTAESVAVVSVENSCLVPGCAGGDSPGHAAHIDTNGATVAFYDKATNSLVGERPKGYNEGSELAINDQRQPVQAKTMVIQASNLNGIVTCEWVKGA